MDAETGLYYYGARYFDPKYSRWLSSAPALEDYLYVIPTNDEVKEKNNEWKSGWLPSAFVTITDKPLYENPILP